MVATPLGSISGGFGALFKTGSGGTTSISYPQPSGAPAHLSGLTAAGSGSVASSIKKNIVITAAHVIIGTGEGYYFVPYYDGTPETGTAPYGIWAVRRVYQNAQWISSKGAQTQYDYSFLVVAPLSGNSQIEDVVGSNSLSIAPPAGLKVTAGGYPFNTEKPVIGTSAVSYTTGYPTFSYDGFAGGTSGGPWIHRSSVVGVVGGLHQGGCYNNVSYSSAFNRETAKVFSRAVEGGPGDTAPTPVSDGCGEDA